MCRSCSRLTARCPVPSACGGPSRTRTTSHSCVRCCSARRCCSRRRITRRSSTSELGGRADAVRLLPLPLAPIEVDLESVRGTFRRQIGVGEDEHLLLFLGRINRLKGLDLLIDSVRTLLGDGTSLAVVGRDDGQLAEIESRFAAMIADGRVRIAGPLYGERPLCRIRGRRRLLFDASALGRDVGCRTRGCCLRHSRRGQQTGGSSGAHRGRWGVRRSARPGEHRRRGEILACRSCCCRIASASSRARAA